MTPIERYDSETGHLVEEKSWVPIVSVCASLMFGAVAYITAHTGSPLGIGDEAIGVVAGGGGSDTVAIYFASNWEDGTCTNVWDNECIQNNFQWFWSGGVTSLLRAEHVDSPAASPWSTARPGAVGRVLASSFDSAANGTIDGQWYDSTVVHTHWGRVFFYVADSIFTQVHPLNYKSTGGGTFEGVVMAWSHLPGNSGTGGFIADSFYLQMGVGIDSVTGAGATGNVPYGAAYGIEGVAQTKLGKVDTWYCLQWETRTWHNTIHGDTSDIRRIVLSYVSKRQSDSWDATDTIAHPGNLIYTSDLNTTYLEILATGDSVNLSSPVDTITPGWGAFQLGVGGRAPDPWLGPYPAVHENRVWEAELAFSLEGHIPCSQTTGTVGTTVG